MLTRDVEANNPRLFSLSFGRRAARQCAHFEEEWDQWQYFLWGFVLSTGQRALVIETRLDDDPPFMTFVVDRGEARVAQIELGFGDRKVTAEEDVLGIRELKGLDDLNERPFDEQVLVFAQEAIRVPNKYDAYKRALRRELDFSSNETFLISETRNIEGSTYVVLTPSSKLYELKLFPRSVSYKKRLWSFFYARRASRIDARALKTAKRLQRIGLDTST